MSLTFSTELVPAADRIDAWQWNARQFCGDCQFRFPDRRSFHGRIESKKVGDLELSVFSSSSLSFSKFPIKNTHSDNPFCTVITQLRGVRSYSQSGSAVVLNPGDSTLIDSAVPWSSECHSTCVRLYLRMPRWLAENHLRSSSFPTAQRISGTSVLGETLFQLATSLYRNADHMTYDEGAALMEAYFDILSACFGHEGGETTSGFGRHLCSRATRFVEEHLREPGLGAAAVASALGVSVRHLHRVFASQGQTLGEYVRERRLQQCRAALEDERWRDRSVTEIAFSCGFSDSAHFSRSFKSRFGISPRKFRQKSKVSSNQTFDAIRMGIQRKEVN